MATIRLSEINDIFEEYLRNNNIEKVKFIVEKTKIMNEEIFLLTLH